VLVTLLGAVSGGSAAPRSTAVEIVLSVNTAELSGEFKAPWQVAWIPGGNRVSAIVFTDRGGNQVGLVDPETLRTQSIRLTAITSPGPIVVIDNTRFAIAGTGGVGIFDRAGSGAITELAMANTRNTALAMGPNGNLFAADAQQNDLRIIRPPYSGPADITKFPLPQQCRGPTGVIPDASAITLLCGQTNNIVRIDYRGNFGISTSVPVANAGAQEARPSPNGFVFSGFNANRVFSFSASYARKFKSVALTGPAVPTVGYFYDRASDRKLAQAATLFRAGKKPTRASFFNSFTPSFRDGRFSFGSFPAATSSAFTRLAGRNLVGSTNGPGGTIWVTDATPGKPALHRISFVGGQKTGRTKTGYRLSRTLTQVDPDFLARMAMPFYGPAPPREVRVGVVGASASPWNLRPTFSGNFGVTLTARATLKSGSTYAVKAQSSDTGAYTRAYRFSGLRPGTRNLIFTFSGRNEIPASFRVDAVAETPPCECDSLDLELEPTIYGNDAEATLGFVWDLECTGGRGACRGTFSIAADKAARAEGVDLRFSERSDRIEATRSRDEISATCAGDCEHHPRTSGRANLMVRPPYGKVLGTGVPSVTVVVERTCKRVLAPKIFEIAFRAGGRVDERRSDLNGNGIRDGKEKK
jgi:hypothetical protein